MPVIFVISRLDILFIPMYIETLFLIMVIILTIFSKNFILQINYNHMGYIHTEKLNVY